MTPLLMPRLKEATAGAHDRVEAAALAHKIMNATLSAEEYRHLIISNYVFHELVEQQWQQAANGSSHLFEIEQRKKTPYLLSDLKELNISRQEIQIPGAFSLKLENHYQLLGSMYVTEGATLGGAVIAKHLKRNPAFADLPLHYYGCYGSNTGTRWKSFCELANRLADTEEKQEQAIRSAVATFEQFEQLLAPARA